MKRLELDFAGRGRRSPWPARLLVGAAAAFSIHAALDYRELSQALERSAARTAQAQKRAAPARAVPAEELAAVRETVDRLALPWNELFGALESAASDQVALLALEPDPKAGTVLISGDSKDYLAALSYVLNLSQAGALSRVQLVRHEVKPNDPQGSVAFAVSAGWHEVRK